MKGSIALVVGFGIALCGCSSGGGTPTTTNQTSDVNSKPASAVNPTDGTTAPTTGSQPSTAPNSGASPKQTPTKPNLGATSKQPQTKPNQPAATQNSDADQVKITENWQPSKLTFAQLAQKMDAKLGSLKSTTSNVFLTFKDSNGKGFFKGKEQIKDSNNFRIEFAHFGDLKNRMARGLWVANGKQSDLSTINKVEQPKSLDSLPISPEAPITNWIENSSLLLFEPLRGAKPFTELAKEASDPKSSSTIKVEQRRFDYKGHIYTQYRVALLSAKPGFPTVSIEIRIDGDHMLPTSIGTIRNRSKKDEADLLWTADYDLQPDKHFEAKTFDFPGKTTIVSH